MPTYDDLCSVHEFRFNGPREYLELIPFDFEGECPGMLVKKPVVSPAPPADTNNSSSEKPVDIYVKPQEVSSESEGAKPKTDVDMKKDKTMLNIGHEVYRPIWSTNRFGTINCFDYL